MHPLRCQHIFLADDDPDDQFIFLEAIREIDSKIIVTIAIDGQSALRSLKYNVMLPDLIVIDINMPLLNGNEVLHEIKQDNILKEIPVVVYSTSISNDQAVELKRLGAKYSFVKPESIKKLHQQLFDILNEEFKLNEEFGESY